MKKHNEDDRSEINWVEGFSANFVQLCGTLAGFCGGFIIFLLSPGLFPSRSPELSIVLLLITAFGYTYAATLSAAVVKFRRDREKLMAVMFVNSIFLISNTMLWIAFVVILLSLNYYWAGGIAIFLLLISLFVSIRNIVWRDYKNIMSQY